MLSNTHLSNYNIQPIKFLFQSIRSITQDRISRFNHQLLILSNTQINRSCQLPSQQIMMKFQLSIFLKEIEYPCSPRLRCFRSFSYKPFLKPLNVSRPKLHLSRLIICVHPILSKPFQHALFIQSFLRVNTQFPHLPLGDTHISPQTA